MEWIIALVLFLAFGGIFYACVDAVFGDWLSVAQTAFISGFMSILMVLLVNLTLTVNDILLGRSGNKE